MALRDAVLAEVAHDEQMTIWTGEVLGSLSVAGYMSEDMAYDDVIHAHELVASEIRDIIGHVVDVLVEASKEDAPKLAIATATINPPHVYPEERYNTAEEI